MSTARSWPALDRLIAHIVLVLAVAMSLFHLYTAGTLPLTPSVQASIHLAFAYAIIILMREPGAKPRGPLLYAWHFLLLVGALAPIAWILSFWGEIPPSVTAIPSAWSQVMAGSLVIVTLVITWRSLGPSLPITTLVFLAYALFGDQLPGIFGHEGTSLRRMLSVSYYSAQGIYGIPLNASAELIFPLVLFGAFMIIYGSSDVFFHIAVRATRRIRGGAALACVLSSSAMGTVTGSGIANATSTGVFTIPLMKRTGYSPTLAAGIESASSSGAQLIPPVMGTAAFVMAEILGIPYSTVAIAALVPGLLYVVAILLQVYLQACRQNIGGASLAGEPSLRDVLRRSWHLLLGPIVLLYLIIGMDMSPARAAFLAIVLIVAIDLLTQLYCTRQIRFGRLVEALKVGALTGVSIAAATACIGLIIGALDITGMTIRLGATVTELAGDNHLLLLMLTAAFCLILGAGLPTLLAYIVVAVTVAPSLVLAGFDPLASHLFVFYFAIVADITPPVGVTYVVAARIAGAPPMRTGFVATRISLIAWMIPFYFVYNEGLLLMGPTGDIVVSIVLVLIGTMLMAVALVGYCFGHVSAVARLAVGLCLATFFFVPNSLMLNFAALGAGIAVLAVDYLRRSRNPGSARLDGSVPLVSSDKPRTP